VSLKRDPHVFFKVDLLRAALQQRGASVSEIDLLLAQLENAASSPEAFKKWNTQLDDKGIQVLSMILTPSGAPLVQHLLDGFLKEMMIRCNVSSEEVQQFLRSINLN
jgi:hypothetical protein